MNRRVNDALSVFSCHVESTVLLREGSRKLKQDSYMKFSLNMEDYYWIKGEEKIE